MIKRILLAIVGFVLGAIILIGIYFTSAAVGMYLNINIPHFEKFIFVIFLLGILIWIVYFYLREKFQFFGLKMEIVIVIKKVFMATVGFVMGAMTLIGTFFISFYTMFYLHRFYRSLINTLDLYINFFYLLTFLILIVCFYLRKKFQFFILGVLWTGIVMVVFQNEVISFLGDFLEGRY